MATTRKRSETTKKSVRTTAAKLKLKKETLKDLAPRAGGAKGGAAITPYRPIKANTIGCYTDSAPQSGFMP